MKNNPFEFADRLWGFFRQEIPEKEAETVRAEIENSPEIKRLVEDLKNKDKIGEELAVLGSFDTERALRKIHSRNSRLRYPYRHFWGAVAAVLVLLGSVLWFYKYEVSEPSLPLVEHRAGGFARVLLQTADGEVYGLDTLVKAVVNHRDITFDNGDGVLNVNKMISAAQENKPQGNNVVVVPYGGTYILKLQDSTRVYLNSGSRLEFPSQFAKSERRVKMSGEVYFEVTHNEKRPFIIEVENTEIRVLGTSFNVKAYPEESFIYATLVEGKIGFTKDGGSDRILTPGQQLVFGKQREDLVVQAVNTQLYTAWKDGLFWFRDLSLEDILKIVGRWYDLEIFYVNPEVKDVRYSGKMKMYSAVEDILRKFEKSDEVYFTLKGRTLTVYRK